VGDVDGERLSQLPQQRLPPALLGDAGNPVVREVGPVPLLDVTVPAAPPAPARHQAAVALPELWVGYPLPGKYSQNVGNTRLVTSAATEQRLRDLLLRSGAGDARLAMTAVSGVPTRMAWGPGTRRGPGPGRWCGRAW
jgi:hypothetical protein